MHAPAIGAACPLPGPVASPLPRLGLGPSPGPQASSGPSHALDSRTFEPASGLRAGHSREVPRPSARLSQFRRPLRSETKVPAGQGLEEERPGRGSPAGGGAMRKARLRRGAGAQERPRRRGARRGSGRAPRGERREPGGRRPRGRVQVGALVWPRSPVGLGGRVQEEREGGRGDAAAPAAAAVAGPTLGRAARGSGTCLRPCDPGAAPAAAPAGEAASSTQSGPGAAVSFAPRWGKRGDSP